MEDFNAFPFDDVVSSELETQYTSTTIMKTFFCFSRYTLYLYLQNAEGEKVQIRTTTVQK